MNDLDPETYLFWNRIHDVVNFIISLTFLIIYTISFYCLEEFKEKCCNKIKLNSNPSKLSAVKSRYYNSYSTPSSSNSNNNTPRSNSKKLHKPTLITAMIYISFYTFRYFLFCINWIVISTDNEQQTKLDPVWYEFVAVVLDVCFVIAHGAFYLIMTLRLQKAFEGTAYEFHRFTIYSFYFGLAVIVVIDILYFLVYEPGHHTRTHLFFTLVALDLIFGFVLIYGFVYKLFTLVVNQFQTFLSLSNRSHAYEAVNADTDDDKMVKIPKIQLTRHQLAYLRLAIKFSLLCSIAIIFTNLQYTGWAIFFLSYEFTEMYWLQLLLNWSYNVVLFIEMYCIWLSFPFASNQYYKVCGKANDCCEKICAYIVSKMIEKNIKKLNHDNVNDSVMSI